MNGILDDLRTAFSRSDNATMQLIVINIIVFMVLNTLFVVFFLFQTPELYTPIVRIFTLPAEPLRLIYRPWTLFTYFFSHEGLFHIFFNMLIFYYFGRLVEEYLGSRRLIGLYVVGGLAGGFLYMLLYNILPVYQGALPNAELIGASASVMAVVVGAATLMPNYQFHLLLLGPVKIKYIAAFWVVVSFFGFAQQNAGGDIAHIGGSLMGYIFIIQLKKGRDLGKWVNDFRDAVSSMFKKKSNLKVTYSKPRSKSKVTTQTAYRNSKQNNNDAIPMQEEIDAILDKISESGYGSLTREEKEKLSRASKS